MRFIGRKQKTEESLNYSWSSNEDKGKGHSMWSGEIKKLLKKVGLC